MRVTTAFNRMLEVPGATVSGVRFTPGGVVVQIRHRRLKLRCPCGAETSSVYDRRRRRWRHLDLGACRLWLEAEVRRLRCRACARVVTEEVPWARPGARHTRDLEELVAYLAQRADKTTVARLLRVSWEAVARIVVRVVSEQLDPERLEHLYRIGVDEVSWRKGHRYLTVVANHDRNGAVVWAGKGKSADTLRRFYDELGPERTTRLEAVSLDMGGAYAKATAEMAPGARACVDSKRRPSRSSGTPRGRRSSVTIWNRRERSTHRDTARPNGGQGDSSFDPRRWVSRNRRAAPRPTRRRTPRPARGRAPRAWSARAPHAS